MTCWASNSEAQNACIMYSVGKGWHGQSGDPWGTGLHLQHICFAEAGAKVTSIEIEPRHRDTALENVQGLDVEVLLGAALDVMPKLADEGRQFDMVFIDADLDGQWELFSWAVKLTRVNGCVFLDDVVASMIRDGHAEEGSESILTKIG